MRTKFSVATGLVLAISLITGPVLTAGAATPKAGAACAKKGLTQVSGGKKFTCTVKGKKLVWNAGVTVTAAPTTKPTPTPSSNPAVAYDAREGDKCDSTKDKWVIGPTASGKLVYLSCGPDNLRHPESNAPEIDQSTGKPVGGSSQAGGDPAPAIDPPLSKASLPKIGSSCKGTKTGRQIGLFEDGAYAQVSCSPDGIWRYIPYYRVNQQSGKTETVDFRTFPADIKEIFTKAWAELRALKNPGSPAPLNIIYSGDIPQWHKDIFESSKTVMLEKFGGWSKDGLAMYWVVTDTPEHAIAEVQALGKKLGASQSEIDGYINVIKESDRWTTATIASGQNGSLAGHAVQFFNSWADYGGNQLFDYHAATHEIFHPLMWQNVPVAIRRMPCWVNEGSASFVGDAVLDPTGNYDFATLIDRQFFHGGGYTKGHPEFTSAINTEISPTPMCGDAGGYMEGDQIVTTLVGLYGWDKFEKFIFDKTATSWQDAFQNAYGLTKDEFYVKMDDILKRTHEWAVANGY